MSLPAIADSPSTTRFSFNSPYGCWLTYVRIFSLSFEILLGDSFFLQRYQSQLQLAEYPFQRKVSHYRRLKGEST
jgi:hypothetical protein